MFFRKNKIHQKTQLDPGLCISVKKNRKAQHGLLKKLNFSQNKNKKLNHFYISTYKCSLHVYIFHEENIFISGKKNVNLQRTSY